MRARIDPSPELMALADAQQGVLSREQAGMVGFGRHPMARLIAEGRWQRLGRGLVFVGPQQPSWLALAWGGILLGGDGARLGGEAAGYLHSLTADPPDQIDVMVPHGTTRQPGGHWRFVQERAGVRSRAVGNPPRTSAEDTLLDLCDERDSGEVINLVISAVQSRRVSPATLRRRLQFRSRVRHRRLIESLVGEVADGVESVLELDYTRCVERPHGLPDRTRQHVDPAGHRRDVRYDEFRTVVELDGRLGHTGMGRFRDMRRDNLAAVSGELTLRYGYWDIHERPCLVARQIGAVLRQRGWTGCLVACPNCRSVPISEAFLP